jgi:hypothetical protein
MAARAKPGGFNQKRVGPGTGIASPTASAARGLSGTTNNGDGTKMVVRKQCAGHRVLNSPTELSLVCVEVWRH